MMPAWPSSSRAIGGGAGQSGGIDVGPVHDRRAVAHRPPNQFGPPGVGPSKGRQISRRVSQGVHVDSSSSCPRRISERLADVGFGAHFGLKPDIA
jgi:hypothetical protein